MKKIQNRIHRVQGQLESLEAAISAGTVCNDVIPQLLAVKGSVDALVRTYLEESLEGCTEGKNIESMQNLIKLLISRT